MSGFVACVSTKKNFHNTQLQLCWLSLFFSTSSDTKIWVTRIQVQARIEKTSSNIHVKTFLTPLQQDSTIRESRHFCDYFGNARFAWKVLLWHAGIDHVRCLSMLQPQQEIITYTREPKFKRLNFFCGCFNMLYV